MKFKKQSFFIKHILMIPLGYFFYYRLNIVNKLRPKGLEVLSKLPKRNVLFVSNHQTYFADVAAIVVLMSASKWRKKEIHFPFYLLWPKLNFYYVAASETMKKSGLFPKLFAMCGAITISRTWRSKGENIKREVNPNDQFQIGKALSTSWLISFPQGTTTPYAPGRKGTAYIIKENKPIVVPIQIDGFRRAFNKKGLLPKKRGVDLKVEFKEPLVFSDDDSIEDIMKKVMASIGQEDVRHVESEK